MRRVVTVPPGIARRSIVVSSIPMVRPEAPTAELSEKSFSKFLGNVLDRRPNEIERNSPRDQFHNRSLPRGLSPLRKGERKLRRRSKALHTPRWRNRSLWA